MAGHTVVLGLGNPVLTDDAFGLRVAERLREMLRADPVDGVDVVMSTRAGFELIDILQGCDQAVIVDCLELPEPVPGRVRKLDLQHFAGSARLTAAHDISIATAFELAGRLGISMPQQVEIFAVEALEVRTLGSSLTEAVAASVEPLAAEIHALLKARASIEGGERCGGTPEREEERPGGGASPRRPFYSAGDDD